MYLFLKAISHVAQQDVASAEVRGVYPLFEGHSVARLIYESTFVN